MLMKAVEITGKFSEISLRLRTVRAYYGMSSKGFAEGAGVPPKSYSQWEGGNHRISIDGALKMQSRYGISLDFIYLGRLDALPSKIAAAVSSNPLIMNSSASIVRPD